MTLDYVKERMEESEFLIRLLWALIKGTAAMAGIFIFAIAVVPWLLSLPVPPIMVGSMVLTVIALWYVFRKDIATEEGMSGHVKIAALVALCSLGYSMALFAFGEVMFIGIVVLGLALTAIFISGDFAMSSVMLCRDLREWEVHDKETLEEAAKFRAKQEAKKAAT